MYIIVYTLDLRFSYHDTYQTSFSVNCNFQLKKLKISLMYIASQCIPQI